ncbi:MAG: rhodanese-like domain-containing protein [Ferruginibacter sp.]|nr:rhodanese-like domain-containing protein [Ferruginibacter sp.]
MTKNERNFNALTISEFKTLIKSNVTVLDSRLATTFTQAFIPTSIYIGLQGKFVEWAKTLLDVEKEIIIVAEIGKELETITLLNNVGFNNIVGFLEGGFETWQTAGEKIDMIIDVEPDELMMDLPHDPNITVLDVRKEKEYADGHLKNSANLPLSCMTDITLLAQFEENENIYVHCAGGYRSVIAASILKKEGIHNLRNVLGGWEKIKEQEAVEIEKDTTT